MQQHPSWFLWLPFEMCFSDKVFTVFPNRLQHTERTLYITCKVPERKMEMCCCHVCLVDCSVQALSGHLHIFLIFYTMQNNSAPFQLYRARTTNPDATCTKAALSSSLDFPYMQYIYVCTMCMR